MRYEPALDWSDGFRRSRVAQRTRTPLGIVPSQDVTRYQARDMPPPIYDLNRADESVSWFNLVVIALALVVTGAGIVLIQHLGA